MDLGDLETEIVATVKRLGKASAREVVEELQKTRDITYSTTATTLDRLFRKGFLRRNDAIGRGGSRHLYSSSEDGALRDRVIHKSLRKLVDAFGPSAIPTIYQRLEDYSESDFSRLKKQIRDRRRT